MSVISDIYDELNTRIDALFTTPNFPANTFKKLVRPKDIVANESLALNRGYGWYFGEAINTNRNLSSCGFSIRRPITFVNTIVARGTERDIDIRDTAHKRLLEDHYVLLANFEQTPTLLSGKAHMFFETDNGIEDVFDDMKNYLVIQSIYNVEYFEDF